MTRHIGHLSANSGAAETLVERLREPQGALDHGTIHGLRLPGKGQRVPGQIPRRHRLLHPPALVARCLFQIFVQRPRPRGPNIPVLSCLPHGRGNFDGPGEIILKILLHDTCLRIRIAQVKVALEQYQYPLDLRRFRCGREPPQESGLAGKRPAGDKHISDEITSSHGSTPGTLGIGLSDHLLPHCSAIP